MRTGRWLDCLQLQLVDLSSVPSPVVKSWAEQYIPVIPVLRQKHGDPWVC